MILETTLNRLREADACTTGYATLLASLGGPSYDHDAPINLIHIVESNGVGDCLWALYATIQDSEQVARLMACDFAEAVLPIYERRYPDDQRPRAAIDTARRYARGEATREDLAAARATAWDTAMAAWAARDARDAAWAAWAAWAAQLRDVIAMMDSGF